VLPPFLRALVAASPAQPPLAHRANVERGVVVAPTATGRRTRRPPAARARATPARWRRRLPAFLAASAAIALAGGATIACGPRAHIPPHPAPLPASAIAGSDPDSNATLARTLAPVLYLQRDETFPLSRVVAVVYPEARVVAYHLLWRDDAHGAWIPFTVPTDEEIVWVGYDRSHAPTEVWTYWHSRILHTTWPRRQVAIDVQWGKHGSLPRGMDQGELPRFQTLNDFWLAHQLGIPDLLLGRLNRPGPLCFCHGRRRYRDFTRVLPLSDRIDVVTVGPDPHPTLQAVFGSNYSTKRPWPWGRGPRRATTPADSVTDVAQPPAAATQPATPRTPL
jgi:hypothetical protein